MASVRPNEKHAEQSRQESSGTQAGSASEKVRSISDAGSQIADSAADMSRRAAQNGAEMLDRNKEAAQKFWELSSELFGHLARQSSDQISRILGASRENADEGARRTSRSFDALRESGEVFASASRDLSREWFGTMRGVIDAAVGHSQSLTSCRTPNEF